MINALKIRALFADFEHEDFDETSLENLALVYEAENVLKEFANYNTKAEKEKYLGARIVCDEVEKLKSENIEKWNRLIAEYQSVRA